MSTWVLVLTVISACSVCPPFEMAIPFSSEERCAVALVRAYNDKEESKITKGACRRVDEMFPDLRFEGRVR